jgi:hypothetical protein
MRLERTHEPGNPVTFPFRFAPDATFSRPSDLINLKVRAACRACREGMDSM